MDKYILSATGQPERCDDLMAWGRWFQNATHRVVARTDFDGGYVSTIFLGLDHRFTNSGEPILWETMIFGGSHDQYQDRYTSAEDAKRGHQKAVELATSVDAVDPVVASDHEPTTRVASSSFSCSSCAALRASITALVEQYPPQHKWECELSNAEVIAFEPRPDEVGTVYPIRRRLPSDPPARCTCGLADTLAAVLKEPEKG